jgi:Uma2 family endonuclease
MPATLDDLLRVKGKAELVGGRIVNMMPTGDLPGEVALNIASLLKDYIRASRRGHARGDSVGYAVPGLMSGRQSFAPDASYYEGPLPENRMRFIQGPPRFAAEVRSENDYGTLAEFEMQTKRADYFEAGTLVVWDVDPLAKRILCYRHSSPDNPAAFASGQIADAEPAVPGWRVAVHEVFETL